MMRYQQIRMLTQSRPRWQALLIGILGALVLGVVVVLMLIVGVIGTIAAWIARLFRGPSPPARTRGGMTVERERADGSGGASARVDHAEAGAGSGETPVISMEKDDSGTWQRR
jgi:hypothetical protein